MKMGDLRSRYKQSACVVAPWALEPTAYGLAYFQRSVAEAVLRRYPAQVARATLDDTDWAAAQAVMREHAARLGEGVWHLCFPEPDTLVYAEPLPAAALPRLEAEGVRPRPAGDQFAGQLVMTDSWGARPFARDDFLVADFSVVADPAAPGGARRVEKQTNKEQPDPAPEQPGRKSFFRLIRFMPAASFARTWRPLDDAQLAQLGVPPGELGLGPPDLGPRMFAASAR